MPIIEANGRKLHVGGRLRPRPHAPRLALAHYLRAAPLPPYPLSVDYAFKGSPAIHQIYLNDQLGDCVPAGAAHLIGAWTGNAGSPAIFAPAAIEAAYRNFSGGAYPTQDSGCDEEFALNYWAANGFAPGAETPHKIVAWVAVDATSRWEVKMAVWLFGGLMSGVELPDAWLNPGPEGDGFVFDVAGPAVPSNGHCMTHFSYDQDGIGVATWGMYGRLTWAALAEYMSAKNNGALYAAVSEDALIAATRKAPNGFDAAQLLADARRFGFAR